MPVISVIVPVYKVEQYLKDCVDSILAQTFLDFELILVDDGSPDNCGKICDEYAEKDARILVVHQKNSGLSAARNTGINNAGGEYITFIDSDDLVAPDYLKLMYTKLQEYDTDICSCGLFDFLSDDVIDLSSIICQDSLEFVLSGREAAIALYDSKYNLSISACAKLYKKKLFNDVMFPEGMIHEDQAIIPILMYKSIRICSISKKLYLYRIRKESITHNTFSLKRYDDIKAIDSCVAYFDKKNEYELIDKAINKKRILLCLYSIEARKSGVYKALPKKYKMSELNAWIYLRKHLSEMKYSYYLSQTYPKLVIVHEYIVKIERMIGIECWNKDMG